MKISCLPVSLFPQIINGDMSLKQWAIEARSLEFDAIDISMSFLKNHTPTYITGLKKDLKEVGMPITMATTYPDFTHPDVMQRKREMEYLRRDIALASELEIEFLRVLAGQAHPDMGIDQGTDIAIESLKKSDLIANEFGLKLLYENHSKPGAWEYTDFSFPIDIFLSICRGIKETDIGINFDIGNVVAYGQNPLTVLKQVIDDVETIHVSDMKNYGKFCPVEIGHGVVPLEEIFSYLKSVGYDKWLCIEEASFKGVKGIKKAVEYVSALWAKV